MKNPKISVVLLTYNRIQFLERAIKNILAQTFCDFELIIINNGCTDNSQEICEGYRDTDTRIKLFHILKNRGISDARNMGIQNADGKYITFIDDDDICEKEMLEFLYNLVEENDADIAICGSYNDYGDKVEPKFVYDELLILNKVEALNELLKREKFNVAPPTKLFKRDLFKKISFLPDVQIDDIHVIYKVFAEADKVVAQGKPLYKFVKHEGNLTGYIQTNKICPSILDEYLRMQRERVRYLSEKVPQITQRVRYSAWSYMISMCDKIRTYNIKDCEKQYDFMVAEIKKNKVEFLNSHFITKREEVLVLKYINQEETNEPNRF